jgi:hypothetical protein
MSSRVAGAGLALIAAALLVVSLATPVVLPKALSLYGGHPTVNGREREVQDVYVGLYNSGLCNTGGDGTCKWKLDETQLGFRVVGYGELAATGGGALALIMLGALTLQRSENRKGAARLVRIAGVIGIAGVAGMIALGPFGDKAGVPIGIGMFLHVAALISGLVASVIAVRPPPPLVLRTAPTPPPQPVVPQPTPVPMYAPTPVPQLRPLYEAVPVPVPVTPPPRAVYEVEIDVEPSLVAPVTMPAPPPPPPRPHPISVPPPIPPRSKPISVPPPPPAVPELIAAPNTEPTSVPDDEPAPPPPAPPPPIIAPARPARETSPPALKPGVRAAVPMPVRAGRLTMPTRPPPLAIRPGLPRPTLTAPVVPPPAIPAIPAIPFTARPRVETEDDHGVHDIPVADDAVGEATDASVRVSDTSPTGEPIDPINGATIATPPIDPGLEPSGPIAAIAPAPPARSTVTSTAFPAPVPIAIPAPTPVVRERPAPKLPISTAPDSLPPPRDDKQQAGPSPACPQCESPMAWVEEHLRFYCKSCRMYF